MPLILDDEIVHSVATLVTNPGNYYVVETMQSLYAYAFAMLVLIFITFM